MTQWIAKDPRFLHADSEESYQTGQIPRPICVFPGRTLILLVLSCHGSNIIIDRSCIASSWNEINTLWLSCLDIHENLQEESI